MDKSQKPSILIREFLGKFTAADNNSVLKLLACTLELFRQAQTPAKNPAFFKALGQLAQSAGNINWGAVPFSFTQATISRDADKRARAIAQQYGAEAKDVDGVIIAALTLFADLVENGLADPEVPAQDIFDAVIAEVAESYKNTQVVNPGSPEIYNERMIGRVFEKAPFTEAVTSKLGAGLVTFRGRFANGERGPAIRGISFEGSTGIPTTLLETGELVRPAAEDFVGTNTAEDYAKVCPALLAYATIGVQALWATGVLNDEQRDYITQQSALGTFKQPHHAVVATRGMVMSLEQVIDAAKEAVSMGITTGATGPSGATLRFPVPDTKYVIVLDAASSMAGPYIVAKLLYDEKVIMRLERPRQYSAHGVYLFPLTDCAVSLTVIS
ncbi:MAG: hypothetical protein EBT15_04185 [Betaproteobacteria bacterium]|nr:hypothetical protein [Betaproteobacteria bacterium]